MGSPCRCFESNVRTVTLCRTGGGADADAGAVGPADARGRQLRVERGVLAAVRRGDEGLALVRPAEHDVARLVADEQGALDVGDRA
jgi:hypothetical protein